MIEMQVRSETGDVLARADCGLAWSGALAGLEQAEFPMLGSLIPYGDAVFNHRQVPLVISELDRIPDALRGPWVAEVRRLGQVALEGPHRYLWFVGD